MVPRGLNKDIVQALLPLAGTGRGDAKECWEHYSRYSIVTFVQDQLVFSSAIRVALQEQLEEQQFTDVHEHMKGYFEERARAKQGKERDLALVEHGIPRSGPQYHYDRCRNWNGDAPGRSLAMAISARSRERCSYTTYAVGKFAAGRAQIGCYAAIFRSGGLCYCNHSL